MITPTIKDHLLEFLIQDDSQVHFDIDQKSAQLGITSSQLDMILDQFQRHQLLTFDRLGAGTVMVFVNAEAHDLHRLGGFVSREEVFKLELEKLQKELDALNETAPAEVERLTTIVSNIFSVVPILFT